MNDMRKLRAVFDGAGYTTQTPANEGVGFTIVTPDMEVEITYGLRGSVHSVARDRETGDTFASECAHGIIAAHGPIFVADSIERTYTIESGRD